MRTFFTLCAIFLLTCSSLSQTDAPMLVTVTGMDQSIKTKESVTFLNTVSGKRFVGITDNTGKFNIALPGGATYQILVAGIGESREYNTIEIPRLKANERYGTYQVTIAYDLPRYFTLKNLQFDVGKATIRTGSYSDLNDLVELMKLKTELNIRVEGHTDNVGEEENNLKLSQQRADAVRNYLINKGIAGNRITSMGFGESRPVATNDTPQGRQDNRRTEIHLVD